MSDGISLFDEISTKEYFLPWIAPNSRLSIAAGVVATSTTSDQSAAAQEMTADTTTNATESSANTTEKQLPLATALQALLKFAYSRCASTIIGYCRLLRAGIGWISGGNNESEPTVTRFDAIVEMTNVSDGSAIHEHTFSNFRQPDIVFASGNSTTINGKMTVTTEDGPTEDDLYT